MAPRYSPTQRHPQCQTRSLRATVPVSLASPPERNLSKSSSDEIVAANIRRPRGLRGLSPLSDEHMRFKSLESWYSFQTFATCPAHSITLLLLLLMQMSGATTQHLRAVDLFHVPAALTWGIQTRE